MIASPVSFLTWLPPLFYLTAPLPQIRKNYRLQSAHGLSTLSVLLLFGGSLLSLPYFFLCKIPFAYRVLLPVHVFLTGTLVVQKFWYSKQRARRFFIIKSATGLVALMLSLAALGILWPTSPAGITAGWLGSISLSTSQLPQIIKIWRARSTKGFSVHSIGLSWSAAALEFTLSWILWLPWPTTFNSFRNLGIRSMQLYQFYFYRNK